MLIQTDYKILAKPCPEELVTVVNLHLKEGWHVQGGVSVYANKVEAVSHPVGEGRMRTRTEQESLVFMQAIVKKKRVARDEP